MAKAIPLPKTGKWIGISVGEVYVDSKKWGKIPLSEFKEKGGRVAFAKNYKDRM